MYRTRQGHTHESKHLLSSPWVDCIPHVLRQHPLVTGETVQRQAPAERVLYPLCQNLRGRRGVTLCTRPTRDSHAAREVSCLTVISFANREHTCLQHALADHKHDSAGSLLPHFCSCQHGRYALRWYLIPPCDQGGDATPRAGAGGAAGAVQVVHRVQREVEVDHVIHPPRQIQSPARMHTSERLPIQPTDASSSPDHGARIAARLLDTARRQHDCPT